MKVQGKQHFSLHVLFSNTSLGTREVTQNCKGRSFFLLLAFLLFMVSCQSCSSPPHLTLFNTDSEWVDLREWPVGYTPVGSHSHPSSISTTKLSGMFGSVYYRESTLFSFLLGNPKRVFSEHQVNVLSNYVSKALDQALPQEVVSFKIKAANDSLRYAEGFCFILDGDFHLVIDRLNKPEFHNAETGPRPNTIRAELVPQPGQQLFASRAAGKGLKPRWIVISLEPKGTEK